MSCGQQYFSLLCLEGLLFLDRRRKTLASIIRTASSFIPPFDRDEEPKLAQTFESICDLSLDKSTHGFDLARKSDHIAQDGPSLVLFLGKSTHSSEPAVRGSVTREQDKR